MKQLADSGIGNARWYAETVGDAERGSFRGDANEEAGWVVHQREIG